MWISRIRASRSVVICSSGVDLPSFSGEKKVGKSSHPLLVGDWTQIFERGMPANPVVKTFDVLKDGRTRLLPCVKRVALNTLVFEGDDAHQFLSEDDAFKKKLVEAVFVR
jgi:hypothetical protein